MSSPYNITLQDVVSGAKQQLGLESQSDYDTFFERLADEGARHMNCLSSMIQRQCSVEIENSRAYLPQGFKKLLGLRVSPSDGAACSPGIYVDLKFLNSCGCSNTETFSPYQNLFQIVGNYIHFHNDPGIADAQLSFMGLNKDSYGLMMIDEDMERGLIDYLCWRYTLRNPDKYPMSVRSEYRMGWLAQKLRKRSTDVRDNNQYMRIQVMEWANAIISDKSWVTL